MRFTIPCHNCEHVIRFYFATIPYSEKAKYKGKIYYIFDLESSIGVEKDAKFKSTVQSGHYIPCPYCDYIMNINEIAMELLEKIDDIRKQVKKQYAESKHHEDNIHYY